jgi:psiF repeat
VQQEAASKNLSGEARKAFMSECLSAKPQMTQQERMTRCNREAGAEKLSGDARKAFTSECLKAK